MTSLKKQLQALEKTAEMVHGPHAQKKIKIKSVLFTEDEAANFDDDAIFDIGLAGLDNLLHDEALRPFQKTLFSEDSKQTDREHLTAEENKRLDKEIDAFILCLHPHFLDQNCQQALEWLVKKYKAHQFNAETLAKSFLLYHSTLEFTNLLSVLCLPSPSPWSFLAKKATDITREEIVGACVKDIAVLEGLFDVALEREGASPTALVPFFTQLSLEYIEKKQFSTDNRSLLSLFRMASLGLENSAELQTGSHMIFFALSPYVSGDGISYYLDRAALHSRPRESFATLVDSLSTCGRTLPQNLNLFK
ncbi:MAG: uncharacterized protein A8A55_1738 [Amphiamblys sp. WSBS2006]|nr:MAG: uncharacterized protein A8A55_1738 [Amphiamblys sp. WSBS2006]